MAREDVLNALSDGVNGSAMKWALSLDSGESN